MAKKYLVSLGAIVLLLLYILYSKSDRRFALPVLKQWKGQADEIIITKAKVNIHLSLIDGKWYLNNERYPADKNLVAIINNRFRELQVTDYISSKGFHERYDLTRDKSFHVVIKQGHKVVRNVIIGKTSTTNKHTYVKFSRKPDVFLVNGIFTRILSEDIDLYRDKNILSIAGAEVDSITISYNKRQFSFYKSISEERIDKNEKKHDDKNAKHTVKKEKWICKEYKKVNLDKKAIDNLLIAITSLKADSYSDKKINELNNPVCEVIVKQGNKSYDIKIFSKEGNKYSASSSHSPYVFFLDEWTVKKFFLKNIDELKANK